MKCILCARLVFLRAQVVVALEPLIGTNKARKRESAVGSTQMDGFPATTFIYRRPFPIQVWYHEHVC